MTSKYIVVVGSCMIDFVSYAPRLPREGETIHGTKFVTNFGGKGANQCVAAAKLGGKTALVARVGDDVWGDKYIANLRSENVNTHFVQKTPNTSSGVAQITVSESGQNQIVIVAGANREAEVAAKELINKGCKSVLLTLGADGVIYVEKNKPEIIHVSCPKVKCLDSTGAGDAFIGALAYLLANHRELPMWKLLEVACFVASDSVTRPGTQISFPGQEVLEKCLKCT